MALYTAMVATRADFHSVSIEFPTPTTILFDSGKVTRNGVCYPESLGKTFPEVTPAPSVFNVARKLCSFTPHVHRH